MKPKLLFVSNSGPFPPRDGKRQRNLALVTAAQESYQVDYLILGSRNEYEEALAFGTSDLIFFFLQNNSNRGILKKLGLSFYPNAANQQRLYEFLSDKKYAKILCRYASSAKDLPRLDNLIIDLDDDYVELTASKIQSENQWHRKARFWQIGKLNEIFYQRILRSSKRIILVKPQKFLFPTSILPNLPFQSILNSKERIFSRPSTNSILFVGKLSYAPNKEGISWFLKEVWPQIRSNNSEISLTIISVIEPERKLLELIQSNREVILKINVSDLESEYRSHALCIVPVFFGGGSNVKLSEALYHYRRVISTPFGIRGFEKWENCGLVTTAISISEWVNAILNGLNMENVESDFDGLMKDYSFEKWTKTLISILDES